MLEAFEFFSFDPNGVEVEKYSFHWQDKQGRLRKRWDNAPHHPTISSHPHHLHDGSESNVVAHYAVTLAEIMKLI